jgi:hypothetical protein
MTARVTNVAAAIFARSTKHGDCLLFAGSDNGHGYQSFAGDYGHRHVYREVVGVIPEGYEVDHLCFQRACVNPAHLEAVTPAENKRRAFAAKVVCKHGHPLPPFEGRRRECAECHRRREAERKERIRSGHTVVVVKSEQHGTATGYNYGCRCNACREAIRIKGVARRRAQGVPDRHGPPPGPIKHGTLHAYSNRGCRCDDCRRVNTEAARQRRARLAGSSQTQDAA